MVQGWKRLLFSLASILAAGVVCLAFVVGESALKNRAGSIRGSEVLLTVAVMVGFCLVAWVLAVPVVLLIRNVSGRRFWAYLALGVAVGPALMVGLCALIFVVTPHGPNATWFYPAMRPLVYLAGAVSGLTSLFYLLLLRWAQGRAAAAGSAGGAG